MHGEGQRSSDARFSLVHIEMSMQMLDLGCRNNTSSHEVSGVALPPSSLLPMLMRKLETTFFECSMKFSPMELQWSRSHFSKTEPNLKQWLGRTCGESQRRFPKNGRDSQRLFSKVQVFPWDRLQVFLKWNITDMMELEQLTQTRVGEPVPFQAHYKHLLILPGPEII